MRFIKYLSILFLLSLFYWYYQYATITKAAINDAGRLYDTEGAIILEIQDKDIILGTQNAPVTIIEYFSYTCLHCAYFHNNVFKEINDKYVATGKVRYIIREFIGNKQDLEAAILARCTNNTDQLLKFISILLGQQEQWAYSDNYQTQLNNIAVLGGITQEQYNQCLHDTTLIEFLISNVNNLYKAQKNVATPMVIINGVVQEDISIKAILATIEQWLPKQSSK